MSERRRSSRHAVQDVQGSLVFQLDATVLNMSLTGMAVETVTRLTPNRVYSIRLLRGGDTLELDGTVVWCHLHHTQRTETDEVAPVYEAGLRFDGTLGETSSRLADFLEHNAVISLTTRLLGRFTLHTERPVQLEREIDFLVREVSLTGLVIETDLSPQAGSDFDLEVHLDERPIQIRGRIARFLSVGDPELGERSSVAIEILHMSPENRSLLEDFIAQQIT